MSKCRLYKPGFLIEEGIDSPEWDAEQHINTGKFDPLAQYAAWIKFDKNDSLRVKQIELIKAMLDFIQVEFISRVKFIYHPIGTCGTGFIDEESFYGTFGWKYTP